MGGNFEVIKLNNEPYDFLIIATSYENPLSYLKEIGQEIQVKKANLLFDLTLINGIKSNRYIQCEYENGRKQLQPCSIVESVDEAIKAVSMDYFAKNEEVVKRSVISNSLKYLLKSGMVWIGGRVIKIS